MVPMFLALDLGWGGARHGGRARAGSQGASAGPGTSASYSIKMGAGGQQAGSGWVQESFSTLTAGTALPGVPAAVTRTAGSQHPALLPGKTPGPEGGF